MCYFALFYKTFNFIAFKTNIPLQLQDSPSHLLSVEMFAQHYFQHFCSHPVQLLAHFTVKFFVHTLLGCIFFVLYLLLCHNDFLVHINFRVKNAHRTKKKKKKTARKNYCWLTLWVSLAVCGIGNGCADFYMSQQM